MLLTYTHRFLFGIYSGTAGNLFVVGSIVGTVCVLVLLVCCTGFVICIYVVLFYLSVFIYLSTVCDMDLIVLVYSLFVAYYLSCDSFETVTVDYGVGNLAVVCLFYIFVIVARAFSNSTCLVRISSALSTLKSSSGCVTAMVTDFARVVSCLLDDGFSSGWAGLLSVSKSDRSIRLLSVGVGMFFYYNYYYYTICSCSSATSVCSFLTVVTIFVVFVVYGDCSNYSTHLILFRRFSILYPYFCSVISTSVSFPSVLFCGYVYNVAICYSRCFANLEWIAASCSLYFFSHLNSIALMVSTFTITDFDFVPVFF